MKHITERYLAFYEYLKVEKIIKTASEFTIKAGIGSSMITKMSKGRSKIGIESLQSTVLAFPELNANWVLTGNGEMLLSTKSSNSREKKDVVNVSLDSLAESQQLMRAQLRHIEDLILGLTLKPGKTKGSVGSSNIGNSVTSKKES